MATQFQKQEFGFADESIYSEDVNTITYRIPVVAVRPNFTSGRSTSRAIQNRLAKSDPGYQMPRAGTIEFDCYGAGANADTATGALTPTWLTKLLGDGLGGSDATEVGGTVSGGSTATSLAFSGATIPRGGIVRVGKKMDGRADGQACRVGNPSTSPATLLTALPAAPNAADVIRAALLSYPAETLGATKRFLFSLADTGAQYMARGCQMLQPRLRIVHGDLPMWTLAYNVGFWEQVSGVSFPEGAALEDCKPRVSTGGSYHLQAVGTATRAVRDVATIELALNTQLAMRGGQGLRDLQVGTGWDRIAPADQPFGTLTIAVQWNGTDPAAYEADGSDSNLYQFMATLSAGDGTAAGEGRHMGFACPQMYYIGSKPTFMNWNGLVYQPLVFGLTEGPDTTNDLTRAACVFFNS